MTKKTVFISAVSMIGFILLAGFYLMFCSQSFCRNYIDIITFLASIVFIFAPLLLFFSLITYKLREEVFRSWIRFTYFWLVPWFFFLSLTMIASRESHIGGGGFGPSLSGVFFVQAFFGVLYISISSSIIILKYVALSRPRWARAFLGILFTACIPLVLFGILSILP